MASCPEKEPGLAKGVKRGWRLRKSDVLVFWHVLRAQTPEDSVPDVPPATASAPRETGQGAAPTDARHQRGEERGCRRGPRNGPRQAFATHPSTAFQRRHRERGRESRRVVGQEVVEERAKPARLDAPTMADFIRALESDLFGSYEWSADLYEDLRAVPEAADRLAVWRGLLRAYDALEGRADDAMKAADALVAAEAELTGDVAAVVASLEGAREALLESATPEAAADFLREFEAAWTRGPREALVPDAILAALAKSNVLASRRVGEPATLHRESALLYADITHLLQPRISAGESIWNETAASAVNRRVVALRLAGDDESAKRLAKEMGAGEFVTPPSQRGDLPRGQGR